MSCQHYTRMSFAVVGLSSLLVAGVALFTPATAQAGIEACGNVYLSASAEAKASCEWIPEREVCTTRCEEKTVYASCAARLYTSCSGECSASAEVTCTSSCSESCVPECTDVATEDQPPNCMGLCMSDCQMDCTDACADAENQGACRSACAHTCSETCHDKCKGTTEDSCEPVCDSACSGSCTGRANIDCQVSCQSLEYHTCETKVVQECKTDCEQQGGALFCNGEYIAHASSSIEECVAAIKAELDIDVQGWAVGECDNPKGVKDLQCEVEAGLRCDVDPNARWSGLGLIGLAVLLGIPLVRRRRRF